MTGKNWRLLAALALITGVPAFGNGTITGRVLDQSDAAVPKVTVQAESLETRQRTEVETNSDGLYVFAVLPSGRYRLAFRKQGFREVVREPVILAVNGATRIDTTLELSTVESQVQVHAQLQTIEQDSAAVSTVIDRTLIENIPLNGRSFHSLMRLVPGVTFAEASVVSTGQFVVNGMRSSSNYFMVDGVGANFAASPSATFTQQANGALPGLTILGGFNSLLTAEALEEFRVQTSGYAAEFGRSPGGQIQMRSRSGSNQYHGSLAHYFRNEVLDANDWFANASNQERAPLRLNQFAAALGGPVWIPGLYRGTDRTFFHFSYEGLRLQQPRFLDALVPTEALRAQASGTLRSVLNAFPLPNAPALPNDPAGSARYRKNISFPNEHNIPALRVDHLLNSNWQLFGRWNHAPSSFVSRTGAMFLSDNYSTNTMTTVGATATFSATKINEFRANWSTSEAGFNWDIAEVDGSVKVPDSEIFPSYATRDTASVGFNFGPFPGPSFSVGRAIGNVQRQLNLLNNLTWVVGTHQMKFGVDYRRMFPQPRFRAYGISYQFATLEGAVTNGLNTTSVQLLAPPGTVTFDNYSLFAQDTWRAGRRITFTYGLRYEVVPAPSAQEDRPIYRISQIKDLMTATIAPPGEPLFRTRWTNFAPRFGIAWQPFAASDLTIRAGTGIFYDLPSGQALAGYNFWPYNTVRRTTNNPFPATEATLAPIPVNTNPPYNDDFRFYDPDLNLPFAWHWNFGVEKTLGSNQTLAV
ncbi:MAG TPA: TonB-dependent receptor, partial [Bryobacteraceae bacterium]|nr:TonB-dependent receptor [Bryobacteraceae bacterium]